MLKRLLDALDALRPARSVSARVVRHLDPQSGLLCVRLVDEEGHDIDARLGVDGLAKTFSHRGRRVRLDAQARAALQELAAVGSTRGGDRGFLVREEDAVDVIRGLETTAIPTEDAPGSAPLRYDARPLEVAQHVELEGDESLRRSVAVVDADGQARLEPQAAIAQADRTWVRSPTGFHKRPNETRSELEQVAAEAAKPVLEGDDVPYFLAKQLADAKKEGRRVILGPRASAARIIEGDWLPRTSVDLEGERLQIDVDLLAGNVAIPLRDAEASKGRRYVRVPGARDTWARNDKAAQKRARAALDRLPGLQPSAKGHGFEAPASALLALQESFSEIGRVDLSEAAARLFGQLRDFTKIESVPIPKGLRATLREYQKKGLDWLCFLRKYGFSGILADDMGLGKTVQTCSALLAAADAGQTAASLVVCPASVVAVWESEIRKWCDGLTPVVLTPSNRDKYLASPPARTVAITSYQAVARAASSFQRPIWNYLVLDEAHRVKNHTTSMAKACKGVLAHHKLAVTGTPIQNRLTELWAIYDSLMPGYLGDLREFNRRFDTPIRREKDEVAAGQLRRLIDPFKLRRLKSQVASDLPSFSRELRSVPLHPAQRQLYADISGSLHLPELLDSLRRNADPLKGLEKLLRLRQVCAHPRLLDPSQPLRESSAKFDELEDLLTQTLAEDHKALVFTQWTGMAKIICELLAEMNVSHLYLDGSLSVGERSTLVSKFQSASGPPVMVLSLLAGGEGITLTQADTVIMYDRWWNPAIEEQAFARAYRIGQTRPVTAYVLEAADTIEQKLARLLEDKRDLAEDLVRVDQVEKRITREQLIALLEQELSAAKADNQAAAQ